VTALTQALTRIFDALLRPIDGLTPLAGLALLSLITAVVVLLAFKWTADQAALSAAKRRMQAAIFEMRLFNDDLGALFRAQGEVVAAVVHYLRHSFAPTLWLALPIALLLVHMEFHFGYTGLAVGAPALVAARFETSAPASGPASASLQATDSVVVETPGVVLPSAREIVWRIRPQRSGAFTVTVHVAGQAVSKTLLVSDGVARRSPVRPASGLLDELRYPSEPPLPAGTRITAVSVDYPERPFIVAGWDIGWAGVYLGLTLAFVLLLKKPFGVTM
jgi:hypothetical protein